MFTEDMPVTKRERKFINMGKLVSVVAHELRSPLAGIINISQLALRRKCADPKITEYLRLICRGAAECENIVKNILGYAKDIPAGDKIPININSKIDEWLKFIKKGGIPGGITLQKKYKRNMPQIRINPEQIKEIFSNLMLNAFSAAGSAAGGRITIETKDDRENIYISISDNGPGIPKQRLDKVFDAFYSTKKTGMGLGLAISRHLAEKHGGSLTAGSDRNKGTRFTVRLPKQDNI